MQGRDRQEGAHDKVGACSSACDRILPDISGCGIDAEGCVCRRGEVVEELQVQEIERRKRVGSRCLYRFSLRRYESEIATSAMFDAVPTRRTDLVTLDLASFAGGASSANFGVFLDRASGRRQCT